MQDDIRPVRRTRIVAPARRYCVVSRPIPKVSQSSRGMYMDVITKSVPEKKVAKKNPIVPISDIKPGKSWTDVKKERNAQKSQASEPVIRSRRKRSAKKTLKSMTKRYVLVYMAAAVIFAGGALAVIQGLMLNKQVQEQSQVLSAKDDSTEGSSQAVPSEKKLPHDVVSTYKVAAELPRVISIPDLSVKARILQVGVDKNNQVMTPKNIYDAAWYNGSSKPGEMGAAIIDGHYVGPTTHGIFSKLAQLKPGSKISIERGDGKVLSFSVVKNETVPLEKVDMAQMLVSSDTSRPGLNIITCSGKSDPKTFEFADRTLVYAVLD